MLQTNRAYFITNKKSGTALDLSSADHVSIAGYAFHGGDNQKVRPTAGTSIPGPLIVISISSQWVILQQESGLWAIQSIGNESFLGVAAAPGDGVRVTGTGVPTLWDIQPVEEDPGNYRYA